jgi:hypothetical protein
MDWLEDDENRDNEISNLNKIGVDNDTDNDTTTKPMDATERSNNNIKRPFNVNDNNNITIDTTETKTTEPQYIFVLMEIVGAMCLETKHRKKVDPYCIVRLYDNDNQKYNIIHRTDTIRNDSNPIWTVQTKSLCLLKIPYHLYKNAISSSDIEPSMGKENAMIMIDIYHGNAQFDAISKPMIGYVTSVAGAATSISPSKLLLNGSIIPQRSIPIGYVSIPYDDIIHYCTINNTNTTSSTGNTNNNSISDRVEYSIKPSMEAKNTSSNTTSSTLLETASMALRFRYATERDIQFLDKLSQSFHAVRESTTFKKISNDSTTDHDNGNNIITNMASILLGQSSICDDQNDAGDINFKFIKKKPLALSFKKRDNQGIEKFRIIPYPDPQRLDTTTWMSAKEMEQTAYEPSTKWITTGNGSFGTIYCEIIGCNNLPQMDVTDFSQTDPVAMLIYEDNFVRTDIIWDQIHPRWMHSNSRSDIQHHYYIFPYWIVMKQCLISMILLDGLLYNPVVSNQ